MCNILRQSAPNDATWRGWHHKGQREAKGVSAWWKGWEGLEGEPCNPQAPAIRVSKFMPPSKNIKCAAAWVEQNWVRTKEQRCELANIAFIIIITINNNISTWTIELVISNGQSWESSFRCKWIIAFIVISFVILIVWDSFQWNKDTKMWACQSWRKPDGFFYIASLCHPFQHFSWKSSICVWVECIYERST